MISTFWSDVTRTGECRARAASPCRWDDQTPAGQVGAGPTVLNETVWRVWDARSGEHLAAVIYAGSFLVTSVFVALQWLLVVRRPILLIEPLTSMQRRWILLRGTIAVPVYLLAALAGLLTPYLTLAVCSVLGTFYLVPLGPSVQLGGEAPSPPERGHDVDG